MSGPFKEADIKLGILRLLERMRLLEADAAIASELSIDGHKRRIDLAIFGSRTVGIEIKSEVDSLRRLQHQLKTYLPYFDELMVVVAERHIEKVLNMAPPQVSVWVVDLKGEIKLFREPLIANEADHLTRLRWLTLRDLRRMASSPNRDADRSELVGLLGAFPKADLQAQINQALQKRFSNSTTNFRSALTQQVAPAEVIALLSRSYDRRKAEKALAERTREVWLNWQTLLSGKEKLANSKK